MISKKISYHITFLRKYPFLLLNTIDQISDSTVQIQEVLAQAQEGSVEAPKVRDSFGMRIGAIMDTLGNINPNSTVSHLSVSPSLRICLD